MGLPSCAGGETAGAGVMGFPSSALHQEGGPI